MARKPTSSSETPEGKAPRRPKAARSATSRRKPASSRPRTKAGRGARKGTTSPWEWVAAAFGAAIFVALVGFLAHAGLTRPESPHPDIVAHAGRTMRLDSGAFLVPISLENLGHDTGANVTVQGSLRDAGGALIEESRTTFDYVAQHSETGGGLFFAADPGTGTLTIRVEGYADP